MPTIANWQDLKELLCGMRAEGDRGFEGLIARLFEAETRERFFVARKGDQPAGDVYSPAVQTALQAKRIDRSVIRENDVEGDIDRALREIPALDVYVVAATNASNQLRLRLEGKMRETGLDIVLLALTDKLSEFGALCVNHWEIILEFFLALDEASSAWAAAERANTQTTAALERLRSELGGLQTQRAVAERATEGLARRFRGEVLGAHAHNRVVLEDAIERTVVRRVSTVWWSGRGNGIAVLEGDEGTGKTWVAAAAAAEIARVQRAPVFWLDSIAWARIETIVNLVNTVLRAVLTPGDDEKMARLCRKVFRRWTSPILIVLDGANERGAWESAERLLHDYDLHRTHLLPRVLLLFTSRRLEHRPFGGPTFWRSARVIPVGAFSLDEFRAALARFAPDISAEDFPSSIRELALIPRYFRLCAQLRARLASLSHVSKELLLWSDLEAKLASRDPQWTGIQTDLGGTPQQILSFLARHARWPADGGDVALQRAELLRHLPNFDRARHDLEDQRIVISANLGETVISAAHVVLGWALVLRETANAHRGEECDALCDRLHRLMEPAASNDDKARAVHVAALLTFLDRDAPAVGRLALLRLWAFHHNAVITPESLGFFARIDLASYAAMVEAFFREHLSGQFESTLIAPLAILWRDRAGSVDDLQAVLERWLRFVYPGDASGSKEQNEAPPPHFPIAATPQQLRLSYAAAGIISFRPDPNLLPALVECYHSDDFTYHDHGADEHQFRFPLKSPMDSLGVLARWHYGEPAIPILAEMARALDPESKEWTNLHWFARLWRQVDLPEALGVAEDIYRHDSHRELTPAEEFRNWLLDHPSTKENFVGIGQLERLAVRRDQPELSTAEADALAAKVRSKVAATAGYRRYHGTWEERSLDDLLPWLARSAPHEFGRQIHELWRTAVASEETLRRLLHLDEMLPPTDLDGGLVQAIMARRDHFSQPENADAAAIPLTEAMLLHASAADLHQWLKSLETRELTRSGGPVVGLLPLPTAMEGLAPEGFDLIAKREAESAIEAMRSSPANESARARASHWLQIYSAIAEPAREAATWALALSETLDADDRMQFPLFHIASRCPDEGVLRRAIFHPAFRQYQLGPASRHWFNADAIEATTPFTFDELLRGASLTVAGQLLFRTRRDDELRLWGHAIVEAAMTEFANTHTRPHARVHIETQVAPDGELEGFSTGDLPSGGQNWHGLSSGVWGVDRETRRPSPTEADYERLCRELHEVMQARRATSRREIAEFNAVGAFWRWSELEPEAFTDFALAFLPRVRASDWATQTDFGFFADAVLIGLLWLNPAAAIPFGDWNVGVHKAYVTTVDRSLDWTIAALWDKRLNASAVVNETRCQSLMNAPHDEALLWHSLAAQRADNAEEIARIAGAFVSATSAHERALGVTLLGYQGDDAALETLARLQDSDPSHWIRDHAKWAWEVCITEIACRSRYRTIVEAGSLELVVAGLAEMRMALSPLVHAWRREIERWAPKLASGRRRRGYLDLFWYHWGNTSSRQKNIKLSGRDLLKFCRGEPLKEGVTGRMAPWWRLD